MGLGRGEQGDGCYGVIGRADATGSKSAGQAAAGHKPRGSAAKHTKAYSKDRVSVGRVVAGVGADGGRPWAGVEGL